jgi:fused signal recognition particle receptor
VPALEVVFLVGVNGAGKTTTTAKLARRYVADGRSVLLAAADTFRAGAIEQLQIWADRLGLPIVRHREGADPSAVLFDALSAAKSRGTSVLLVDTAGRLHTKHNLMEELAKMRRVAGREVPGAPHSTLLVMDATTGANGLAQARRFMEAAGATGVVLTKLDGSAKGGIVLAIYRELGLPVVYVGVGEGMDDLVPFDPSEYAEALLGEETPAQDPA